MWVVSLRLRPFYLRWKCTWFQLDKTVGGPHSQCDHDDEEKNPKAPTAIIRNELSRIVSLMRQVLKINCNVLENTEAGNFKAAVPWYHVLSRTYQHKKRQKDKFLYLEMPRNTRSATTQCGNSAPNRPASNVIPLPSLEIKTLGLSTTTVEHNTNSVNQGARARSLHKQFTHVGITVNLIGDLTSLCSQRNGKLMTDTKTSNRDRFYLFLIRIAHPK